MKIGSEGVSKVKRKGKLRQFFAETKYLFTRWQVSTMACSMKEHSVGAAVLMSEI